MRGRRSHLDYLQDILQAAKDAIEFAGDADLDEFCEDKQMVYAVVRALEIIGEAASQIPASVRSRYLDVPWSEMIGMRNKVIHEYFGVDLDVVWQTVRRDLPPLRRVIERIIADIERE